MACLSHDEVDAVYRASITKIFDAVHPRPDWLMQFAEGDAGPVLVRQAERARLLVIGTPEHIGLGRLVAGSVGHYCLSKSWRRSADIQWLKGQQIGREIMLIAAALA